MRTVAPTMIVLVAVSIGGAADEPKPPASPGVQAALDRHEKEAIAAADAYRAAVSQAKQTCLETLDAALKIAMRNTNLAEAKAIETRMNLLKAELAGLEAATLPVTADAAPVPVPAPAPPPVTPAPLPTIGLADVKVSAPRMSWGTLKVGNPAFNDKRYLWALVPDKLVGRSFTILPGHQGWLEFEVVTPGKVIMAVTQDWAQGDEYNSRAALLAAGWKEQKEQPLATDGNNPFIYYFTRQCRAGEKLRIKTSKYVAPILIK